MKTSVSSEITFIDVYPLRPSSPSQPSKNEVKLGDTILKNDGEPTYLEITFDKRQTWRPHIQKAETKARRKLKKLAGTIWGANENIMKTVYQGTVRPHLEYGSLAWATAASTNQQILNKVQNQTLQIITGAEKYRSLPNHPMNKRLQNPVQNRLKRTSFVQESRKLKKQHLNHIMSADALSLDPTSQSLLSNEGPTELEIRTNIPALASRDEQNDPCRKALTLAMIHERCPKKSMGYHKC